MTEKIQYLPFRAINAFMLPEYRQEVIQKVFAESGNLSGERRAAVNTQVSKYLKVPGFRNSAQAPLSLKVKGAITAFEDQSEFTAQILAAWAELNLALRQEVYDLLVDRKWEVLPHEANRTVLPGFLPEWPKKENYDKLDKAYRKKYPESKAAEYDIRLMVVWIGGRLAFEEETKE